MELGEIKLIERMIDIKNPKTGELLGITISLISIDDPQMKRIKQSIENNRLRLEARGKNFKAEEIEDNRLTLCFKAMTGWNWGKDANGEQTTFQGDIPEFNRKNVYAVFEAHPWFREQIEEGLSEEKDFFA